MSVCRNIFLKNKWEYLSIYLSIYLPIYLSIYLSLSLSLYLSIYLSVKVDQTIVSNLDLCHVSSRFELFCFCIIDWKISWMGTEVVPSSFVLLISTSQTQKKQGTQMPHKDPAKANGCVLPRKVVRAISYMASIACKCSTVFRATRYSADKSLAWQLRDVMLHPLPVSNFAGLVDCFTDLNNPETWNMSHFIHSTFRQVSK